MRNRILPASLLVLGWALLAPNSWVGLIQATNAPKNFSVQAGINQVLVTWTPGGNSVTAHNIYRSTSSNAVTINTTTGAITSSTSVTSLLATCTTSVNDTVYISYNDATAVAGTTYYYWIASFNGTNSPPYSAVTYVGSSVTPANGALTLNNPVGQISLSWTAPAAVSGNTIAYYVFRTPNTSATAVTLPSTSPAPANFSSSTAGYLTNTASATYSDTSVSNGAAYSYSVASVITNTNNTGVTTAGVNQTLFNGGSGVPGAAGSATAAVLPSMPTLTSTPQTNGSINLSWTTATQSPTNYYIFRSPNSTGTAAALPTTSAGATTSAASYLAANGNGTTHIDPATGLTPGTTYTYTVAAVNSAGAGTPAATASALTYPAQPTNLQAAASNNQIQLTWNAVTPAPSGNYNVYKNGSATPTATNVTSPWNDTAGLVDGTSYSYTVAAVNASGKGPLSTAASATALVDSAAPVGLTATPSNGMINLAWTAPTTGATVNGGYYIFRSTSSTDANLSPIPGTNAAGLKANADYVGNTVNLTYTDATAVIGTSYYYTVAALNTTNGSGTPSTVSVAAAPTAPASTAITLTSATYTVTQNLTATSSYGYGTSGGSAVQAPNGGSWSGHSQNWFSITLTAGTAYAFTLSSTSITTTVLSLQTAGGTQVQYNAAATAGFTYTPTSGGSYNIICSRNSNTAATGTQSYDFTLTVTPLIVIPSSGTYTSPSWSLSSTSYTGNAADTTVSSPPSPPWTGHQQNWYIVSLAANTTYLITQSLAITTDTAVLSLQNPAGTQVAYSNSSPGSNSLIVYTTPATGGTYTIICSRASNSATAGSVNFTLTVSLPQSVPLSISDSLTPNSYFGNAAGTSVASPVNPPWTGHAQNWYIVNLTAETTYEFIETPSGTGDNADLSIQTSSGTQVAFSQSGKGSTALIVYTPTTTGAYTIICSRDSNTATANWPFTLTVTLPQNVPVNISDSLGPLSYAGNNADSTVSSPPNAPWNGHEQKWYLVNLTAGTTYAITQTLAVSGDNAVLSLQDPSGTQVSFDAVNLATAEIVYTPKASGTYTVICSRNSSSPTDSAVNFTLTVTTTTIAPPTVTPSTASLAMNASTLTISGSNFSPTAANNSVAFNLGAKGTVTTATSTSLTVSFSTRPASRGALNATVSVFGQAAGPSQVATTVAAVAGLSPSSGPITGGTTVTITGVGFTGATAVAFGSTPATSFQINSDTSITAVTPSSAAGPVNVVVTAGGLASQFTSADQFTFYLAFNYSWTTWSSLNWSTPAGASITWNSQTVPVVFSLSNGFYSWYAPASAYTVNPTNGAITGTAWGIAGAPYPWTGYSNSVPPLANSSSSLATNLAGSNPSGMDGPFADSTNNGNIVSGDWKDFATGQLSYYGPYSNSTAWQNPVFWNYYNTLVTGSQLPSTYNVTATTTTVTNNAGYQYFLTSDGLPNSPLGRTSYVGNSGMYYFNTDPSNPGNAKFANGPFFQDSRTKLADITDGTSNTLLFGESLGGPNNALPTYQLTWMGSGTIASFWDCQTPSQYFMFSSMHPGVVNFAFCDGSVRSVTTVTASVPPDTMGTQTGTTPGDGTHTNSDTAGLPAASNPPMPRWIAFQQLAGINDNATVDLSQLGLVP